MTQLLSEACALGVLLNACAKSNMVVERSQRNNLKTLLEKAQNHKRLLKKSLWSSETAQLEGEVLDIYNISATGSNVWLLAISMLENCKHVQIILTS